MYKYKIVYRCGNGYVGEIIVMAVNRIMAFEVFEELGLKINLQNERPHLTNYFADGFNDIYILNMDLDLSKLKLQAEEVQNVKWATMQEIFTMLDEKTFIPYHKAWIELLFHRSKTRSNKTSEITR